MSPNAASSVSCPPRRKEVWVASFSMIAGRATRMGIDLPSLCAGLGFYPADCDSRVKRIDWEDFVIFLDRCVAAFGGLDAFERVFSEELQALHGRLPLCGLCTSPRSLYVDMTSWLFLNAHQSLDFVARDLGDDRVRWSCSVRSEYSPSEPVMRSVCVLARQFGSLCDMSPANVEVAWTDRDCECLISLPATDAERPVARPSQIGRLEERSPRGSLASMARASEGSRRVRERAIRWGLSPREAEVFDHVASGKQNKEVATLLEVSVKTVEKHLANVMQKARVHSRTELLSALLQG